MLRKTFNQLCNAVLDWQTSELLKRKIGREGHIVQARPAPARRALRFARVKRNRADKTAARADTLETVRRLFLARAHGVQH